MVRFILSDSKATLADGVFTYTLDQRLNNASVLQLKKCVPAPGGDRVQL